MAVLYWIHTEGMDLSDGYVGVAKDFETRKKQHLHAAYNLDMDNTVYQKMREHKGEIIWSILMEGTEDEMYYEEFEHRSWANMGWNMASGGRMEDRVWEQPESWIDAELWHPVHGDVKISEDLTVTDFARKFFPDIRENTVVVAICYVLKGHRVSYKDWELRDSQLARKVKEWLESPWDYFYAKKGKEVVLVYLNGSQDFWESEGTKGQPNLKQFVKGIRTINGWTLATEEEYNDNPGRVFGFPEGKEE